MPGITCIGGAGVGGGGTVRPHVITFFSAINLIGFVERNASACLVIGNLSFTVVANNYNIVTIAVYNPDGSIFDLTGLMAIWQVKNPVTGAALITKKTSDSSLQIAANLMTFSLEPADTVDLQDGDYKAYPHEAIIIDSIGNAVTVTTGDPRLSWGNITIRKEITVQP